LFLPAVVSNENSPVLPIHGDVDDEITLSLNLPEGSNNLFKLNGKILQLVHPLDRDKENLSHIQFSVSAVHRECWLRVISTLIINQKNFSLQISCSIKSMPSRSRNIPIIVRVSDINDETPVFINTPYETSIDEVKRNYDVHH
jgi:protocadherin-15